MWLLEFLLRGFVLSVKLKDKDTFIEILVWMLVQMGAFCMLIRIMVMPVGSALPSITISSTLRALSVYVGVGMLKQMASVREVKVLLLLLFKLPKPPPQLQQLPQPQQLQQIMVVIPSFPILITKDNKQDKKLDSNKQYNQQCNQQDNKEGTNISSRQTPQLNNLKHPEKVLK